MDSSLLRSATARRAARRVKRRIDAWRAPAGPGVPPDQTGGQPRLVTSPIFLFSSERSGSTLLRMILDSHSQVCAPPEMHLRALKVNPPEWLAKSSLKQLGFSPADLDDLLWDRLLHVQLTRSGKSHIVDKTPYNTYLWERLSRSWPAARYIFLKRHPLRIYESLAASRPDLATEKHYRKVNNYASAWAEARAALPGATVGYEELTAEPERVVRSLCRDLGIAWEPTMLDYGAADHGGFRRGLGDWTAKIKSGVIHSAGPPPGPDEVPAELHDACRAWGYL